MRRTKAVTDGLWAMAGIADTILQAGGEGWAMDCHKGPGHEPCDRAGCAECTNRKHLELAVSWLTALLKKKVKRR